jgi:hypothetical protein
MMQKFLVDNSWSMRQHWARATYVVETLGMKLASMDSDGVELLFTRGCDRYKRTDVKGFDVLGQFGEAMRLAEAGENRAMYHTDVSHALFEVLSEYRRDMSKKLTVVVLTTGEWEKEGDVMSEVGTVLASAIGAIYKARQEFCRERRCTTQFIPFTDNHEALQRLRDLGDKLCRKHRLP